MPYTIRERDGQYCVVKVGEESGEAFGCHSSRAAAADQIAAIESNEDKAMSPETPDAQRPDEEANAEKGVYVPMGVTSFAELDAYMEQREKVQAIRDMTWAFQQIVDNIMFSDNADKAAMVAQAANEFASRIDTPQPAAEDDMPKARASDELPIAQDKSIVDWYLDKSTADDYAPVLKREHGTMTVFKQRDGSWRWLAIWSNNFKDRDNPPDIISKAAHERYAQRVQKGELPYPELWHWHTPGTAYGKADTIATVPLEKNENAVMMMAGGYIYKGHEAEAEHLSKSEITIGVSHGMKGIRRDNTDPSVITDYVTYEISDLPLEYAANPYTEFIV